MITAQKGQRKYRLGVLYLVCCTLLNATSIINGTFDWPGAAALAVSMATGLGVIVWGNRAEHSGAAGP